MSRFSLLIFGCFLLAGCQKPARETLNYDPIKCPECLKTDLVKKIGPRPTKSGTSRICEANNLFVKEFEDSIYCTFVKDAFLVSTRVTVRFKFDPTGNLQETILLPTETKQP